MDNTLEKYPAIVRYNELWEQGEVSKPVVFLIGGYAGTGKSTLAKEITNYFKNINVLPTGIIRSILREYVSKESNPYLYAHTYNLHTFLSEESSRNQVAELYEKQVAPISSSINQIIDFSSTEKQHWIIDGNHVLPKYIKWDDRVILFEFYLQVTDASTHRKLLGGPTHNRTLDNEQFHTARKLHDYTVAKVTEANKLLYEYNLATKEVLSLVDQTLSSYLEKNHN